MTNEEIKVNKQRAYWMHKAEEQLQEVFMASLERDKLRHKELLDDLITSLIVMWRMDDKLHIARTEYAPDVG